MLEDDGGGGGGVIDDRDLVDVFGVDEFLDDGSGLKDSVFEVVEVEVVRLAEIFELPVLLGGDDGGGAASKAAVVDTSDGRVVMGELRLNLGRGDEGELRLFGYVRASVVVIVVGGHERVERGKG